MSFDSPWRWTDGQFAGFREGMGRDVSVEYKVFQMDVKRNSSTQAKSAKGGEARALIDSWQPDLVYTSDDDALEQVVRPNANRRMPFVFSGANQDLVAHGLRDARNVTGVLEEEHFVESVRLLQRISPTIRRLAVISDDGPQFQPIIARMRERIGQLPGVSLAAVDVVKTYEEYQQRLLSYPAVADAVVQLGVFSLRDKHGGNVPYQQVQQWSSQNSRLPDLSFWIDRVHFGVLASVTVSEYQQGLAAGKLARAILREGKTPAALAVKPTVKGHPVINLARAKALGLSINSSILLSSEIVQRFEWAGDTR